MDSRNNPQSYKQVVRCVIIVLKSSPMDPFKIDGHKYMYHPRHSATLLDYINNPSDTGAVDRYKKQYPIYIEVSPVGACNHRCTFCAVDYIGYKSTFMDLDVYKRSIDSISDNGVKSIMFAGEGEPMLHPQIPEFINYTKSAGIDVSFTTNGTRLTKPIIEESLENISWIKVSFNAGTPEAYAKIHRTKEKDFELVSENILNAVNYKKANGLDCAIGLQALLLPDNAETMPALCRHAKDLGVDYVVIKPYSQHRFSDTKVYQDVDYTQYLSLQPELESYNDDEFNVVFRVNTIKNWLSQSNNRYCKCYATPSTWAYIMADGAVYSCSAYLLDPRFNLGNINDNTLEQIWCSDRRISHSNYVLNELDIAECRVNCRMDQVNRYIDSIQNNSIPHQSFI